MAIKQEGHMREGATRHRHTFPRARYAEGYRLYFSSRSSSV